MSDHVTIRTFSYRHEAEVVRSFLDGHGIEAWVTSDDCGAVDPALGLVRGARLVVAEGNAARAQELLDSPPEPAPAHAATLETDECSTDASSATEVRRVEMPRRS